MRRARADTWERFYAVVRKIPRGRVATYGEVAERAGLPGYARQVGWALHALRPGTRVPWQRVVNVRGACSVRLGSGSEFEQRRRLEREGVEFGPGGRIDLGHFGWPRDRAQ
ncbi:MAG: MGMT family protein [Deltaproteobacteria bacterium]|nr:MGMT family protein [Deltaproteobacteria bacterium]MBW2362812.1 MGMT family protein [Deltaproteobacteria bacterium]